MSENNTPEQESQDQPTGSSLPEVDTSIPEPAAPIDDAVLKQVKELSDFRRGSEFAHNVKIDRPMVTDRATSSDLVVDMPSAAVHHTQELVEKFPNLSGLTSAADINWSQRYMSGMFAATYAQGLDASLRREGSEWSQGVKVGGETIKGFVPVAKRVPGQALTSDQAVQMAMSHLGLGDFFMTPLWESGFWVMFKPVPDYVWIEINRLLGIHDIKLGRNTYGLVHSGQTSLTVETIINSITPYIHLTSVKQSEMPISDVPNYLAATDKFNFIWGFICANYPQGFTTERACFADITKCRHVVSDTLEVPDMQLVDWKGLGPDAIAHMRSKSPNSMSLQSVLDYQKKIRDRTQEVIEFKTGSQKTIKMRLEIPALKHEFDAMTEHVQKIREAVLRTVTSDTAISERDRLLEQYMVSAELSLYRHWITEVIVHEDFPITDKDAISKTLDALTKDAVLRANFFEKVTKFVDNCSYSVLAIETLKCPNCGAVHSNEHATNPEFRDCVPVDIVQLFSVIAEQNTRAVRARS